MMRKFSPRAAAMTTMDTARRVAAPTALPPPVEGWDAISPIAAMSPKRAIQLDNWFPQPSWCEIRRGHIKHADTGVVAPVETLMAYQGATNQKLFAAAGDSIYDVTAGGLVAAADVSALDNARFQFINFSTTGGHFLQAVNGADPPQYYDGSTWQVATITGSAGPAIGINAHKNRIWYIPQNSTAPEYLPVDSIQGAVSAFELGGLMTMGGYVMAMGTWSVDAGDGPDDYAVFITSRGQVAIYKGINPADATQWSLVGVFNMGAPIGRRCLTRVGADIAIISIDGVLPLSRAMIFERAAVVKVSLTERIQRVMNSSARQYGDNFGWQLISYPKGTRAILNVPIVENETQYQYVMNTITGAWCRFLGDNANCWELLDDVIYFGGNDGLVYQGDTSGTLISETLTADMKTAFSYYGSPGLKKRWTMCQPLLTTDRQVSPGIALNVDFQDSAPLSVLPSPASFDAKWDVAKWDQAVWAGEVFTQTDWVSVAGIGSCASIRLKADVAASGQQGWGISIWGYGLWGGESAPTPDITLIINGFSMTSERGAFV